MNETEGKVFGPERILGGKTAALLGILKEYVLLRLGAGRPLPEERNLNKLFKGYPSNHSFRIIKKRLVPGLELLERWKKVRSLYPEDMDSLLDIGCSKGFFVLDAACRDGGMRAKGIDKRKDFIDSALDARSYLGLHNAVFEVKDPFEEKERFHTVLVLNVYHYLFWTKEGMSHAGIFRKLREITGEALVFSSPMEFRALPRKLRLEFRRDPRTPEYTENSIIEAASGFFRIERAGFLGKRPLLLMRAR